MGGSPVVDLLQPGRVVEAERRAHDCRQVNHRIHVCQRLRQCRRVQDVALDEFVAGPLGQIHERPAAVLPEAVQDADGDGLRLLQAEVPHQLGTQIAAAACD